MAKVHYPWLPVELILVDASRRVTTSPPLMFQWSMGGRRHLRQLSEELAEGVGNLHAKVIVANAGHNDPIWHGPFLAEQVANLADEVARSCR